MFDTKMPFEILEEFASLEQSSFKSKGTYMEYIDENILKIHLQEKKGSIIGAIFSFLILFIMLALSSNSEDDESQFMWYLCLSVFAIAGVYSFVKIFIKKKSMIILDRKNGLFSFPHRLNKYKHYEAKFDEIIFYWQGTGGPTGNLGMSLIAQHPNKKIGGADLKAHVTNYRKLWSFYVWYMDKNRPLPPGTAFDAYRQKDFERRKAEGFPKPLYRSHIITPEATEEQQKEREQYWKDELEEFIRESHSVMYDPEIHRDYIATIWLEDDDTATANTYFKFEYDNGEIVYI